MDLLFFFQEFNPELSHHIAAINNLQDSLPKELLSEDADWVVCFKAAQQLPPDLYNKDKKIYVNGSQSTQRTN